MGLTAVFYNAQTEEEVRKVQVREPEELNNLRAAQTARLHAAAHYEQSKDVDGKDHTALIIPIEQAMDKTVQEYGQKK
jgi:hypothetical protein